MARTPSIAFLLLLCAACWRCASSPPDPVTDPRVAAVQAFCAAREAGDFETCKQLVDDDPRQWWDAREGEGSPMKFGAGRWSAWDEHFRGKSEQVTDWVVDGEAVWADFFEINDYFLLTERGGGYWRSTYFFDANGKISGSMVSAVAGRPTPKGRGREFEAWARAAHPQEAEYLMPGGNIDPTGDRAPRMRALLNEWRETVSLAPLTE
jgi:hypothetical protein